MKHPKLYRLVCAKRPHGRLVHYESTDLPKKLAYSLLRQHINEALKTNTFLTVSLWVDDFYTTSSAKWVELTRVRIDPQS